MSITSGDTLTRVQKITKRDKGAGAIAAADIDEELVEILLDLSRRGAFLPTSATGTITGNAVSISTPSDYMFGDTIQMTSGNTSGDVLCEITMVEFLKGQIEGFVRRGSLIYIHPTSSSARTYTLYYSKEHDASADTIEFADRFGAAIKYGVAYKVEENHSQWAKAEQLERRYVMEVDKLMSSDDDGMAVVEMRSQIRE